MADDPMMERLTAIANGEDEKGLDFDPLSEVIVPVADLRALLAAYQSLVEARRVCPCREPAK